MSFIPTNEELGLPENATEEGRAAALAAACRDHHAQQGTGGKRFLEAAADAYAEMATSGLPAGFDNDPVASTLRQRIAELGQPTTNTKGT